MANRRHARLLALAGLALGALTLSHCGSSSSSSGAGAGGSGASSTSSHANGSGATGGGPGAGGGSGGRGGAGCTYDPKATDCFAKPSACCYPDPTNTGVPPGTKLTKLQGLVEIEDGSVTVGGNAIDSAPWLGTTMVDGESYLTLTGISLHGGMYITQDHVRIVDSELVGGDIADQTACGQGGPPALGSSIIVLSPTATHFRIEDSTLRGESAGCDTSDPMDTSGCTAGTTRTGSGISNDADDTSQAIRIQASWLDSPWHGAGTVSDSYLLDDAFIFCAHYEPIYISDATLVVRHSTLLNIHDQTAAVFVDTQTSDAAGDSHLTITDSLLAGGGYTLYPAGNSTSPGSGTMDIERNRFARCRSKTCPDAHGYYPKSGYFGIAAYCWKGAGQTWQDNVWDDDAGAIADPCN